MFDFLAETLAGDEIIDASGETGDVAWSRPEPGVMIFEPSCGYSQNIIISAAIHGNETAPIEIINRLIGDILNHQYPLKVRLMVIFGNLEAMRKGERYLKVDLNRLFSDHYLQHECCYETKRAATLQQLVANFYSIGPDKPRAHFDLHTAIRASRHIAFGLLPYQASGCYQATMITWLQSVGLEALVVNHAPAATFSYFSSHQFGANSCTLELGKAKPFGQNDLQQFSGINQGLINLITEQTPDTSIGNTLTVYKVAEVISKRSEQFILNVADDAANFTAFPKGFILASDRDVKYQVKAENGYILFPNNKVKIGFRAGLLLSKADLSALTLV
ncbi:MAG: succinylglutamate desuccinylase [Psychromonas sp.]|jgi:succinylglutamate desuccinylase|uniref:succinylglutamate desuccinylase n=1 Tax=Psychromonas sp. TaxID=1884585 RepID=UPI0039E590ED